MDKDLYNSRERFEKWVETTDENGIESLNKKHSALVIQFIKDFSLGINVSKQSKKGARSFNTLNRTKDKLVKVLQYLEKRKVKDVTKVKEIELHKLFNDMKTGKIKNRFGTAYKSTWDYVKNFKTFWHWHQKVEKKKGNIIPDVTEELDRTGNKPKFVYFTEEDFNKMLKKASADVKPIMALAFDSGARITELANIRVSDFSNDFKEVMIKEETSKTFGRKIKLMLCSEQIRNYAKKLNLQPDDFIMRLHPVQMNKELRQLGKKFLTAKQTEHKNLSAHDFRHSSACFWLPRYKSESSLKYRFGWKKSSMIHYYTEFLGMKDTITEDDLYTEITKAELEKDVDKLKKEIEDIKSNILSGAIGHQKVNPKAKQKIEAALQILLAQ